jgi:hypothetical protein
VKRERIRCLISIAEASFSVNGHLRRLRGILKIVFQLELLSAGASPQVREPDNLRTFVSSPLIWFSDMGFKNDRERQSSQIVSRAKLAVSKS